MDLTILCNFLRDEINPNIVWRQTVEDFLSGRMPKKYFFNRIRSYAWYYSDRNSLQTSEPNKYIKEYTYTIMSADLNNKLVGILFTDMSAYPKPLEIEHIVRFNAIVSILLLKRYKVKKCVSVEEANECDVIIPLTSFATPDAEKLNKNKLLYTGSNNYSIIKTNAKMRPIVESVYNLIHEIIIFAKYDNSLKIYNYNYIFMETI